MKVKIKTWEEMEQEFGLNSNGNIDMTVVFFTRNMERLMPEDRIIEVDENDRWYTNSINWKITNSMIKEEICENNEIEQDFINKFSKNTYYSNIGKFELCTRKTHHTHYIKWNLTENLSIRYFYSFRDNDNFTGKFILKNHSKKESVIISKDTARELLEFVKDDFQEIIGYLEKDEYRKMVLVRGDINSISLYTNDNLIKLKENTKC